MLKMAETQAAHRQELEKRIVKSDIIKSYLGVVAGFSIAVLSISCGSYLISVGQAWGGVIIGGGTVATLVWAFLKGTNDRREERETKEAKNRPERISAKNAGS
ncbi:MAG: hypothetical protein ACRCZF_28325 [Gemmataceae bacterium]